MLGVDVRSPVKMAHPLNHKRRCWLVNIPGVGGGGGDTFRDLMRKNDGSLINMGPSNWKGPSGRRGGFGSLKLNGTNEYIDILDSPSLKFGTGAFTITGAFKLDAVHNSSSTTTQPIITRHTLDSLNMSVALKGTDYSGGSGASGTMQCKIDGGGYFHSNINSWDADRWYEFVISFNQDGTSSQLWINGVNDKGGFSDLAIRPYDDAAIDDSWSFGLGEFDVAANLATTVYLAGSLDDLGVFEGKFSDSRAMAFYKESQAGHPNTLNFIPHRLYAHGMALEEPEAVSSSVSYTEATPTLIRYTGGESHGVGYPAAEIILTGVEIDTAGESHGMSTLAGSLSARIYVAGESHGLAYSEGTATFALDNIYLVKEALIEGYAVVGGHVGTPDIDDKFNPAAFFAALREGWTVSEALAVAVPKNNSNFRLIGDPLAPLPMPKTGFIVRRADNSTIIAAGEDAARSIDLDSRLTGPGEYNLILTRANTYGDESPGVPFVVEVGAGGVAAPALSPPEQLRAIVEAAGYATLTWQTQNDGTDDYAAEYEIAFEEDPATILATITGTEFNNLYTTTLGPYTDGQGLKLMVRASDGVSVYGEWIRANPITADATPPDAPVIVEAAS